MDKTVLITGEAGFIGSNLVRLILEQTPHHETYDLSAIVAHCPSNYGPYQFPEKLIPMGFIDDGQLERLAVQIPNEYGQYLLEVLERTKASS